MQHSNFPELTIQHLDEKNLLPSKPLCKVGIHGIEGSFTHLSLLKLLEHLNIPKSLVEIKYLVEAKRVMDAALKGEVDRGVMAVANSGSGVYVSSMQVMADNIFEIPAVYNMPINQCLMAHSSVSNISEIKQIFGHPKAIEQCMRTLKEQFPQIEIVKGQDSDDTALCAKQIAQGELPKTTATLASSLAAELYGLKILKPNMQHDPYNNTVFLVVKKKE